MRRIQALGIKREHDASVNGSRVYLRPHAHEFVRWCSERFAIVVWSTAKAQNGARRLPPCSGTA